MPLMFIEPPRVERIQGRPFAFARLPENYARELEALAHALAPKLDEVAPEPGMLPWAGPYGSRFMSYNIFLLDRAFQPLFWAMRSLYRSLIGEMSIERRACSIRGWLNVQNAGERIGRHLHEAKFIGTFAARAEGSETRFGLFKDRPEQDVIIPNVDGQLLLTFGLSHFHETSVWERTDVSRVTYAMDILSPEKWGGKSIAIPFDSPPMEVTPVGAARSDS